MMFWLALDLAASALVIVGLGLPLLLAWLLR